MQRSLAKKLYIVGVVGSIILALYLLYLFLVCSLPVKLAVLAIFAAYKFTTQIGTPVAYFVNHWYFKLVYENSIFWELFYDTVCYLFPSAELNQINYGYAPENSDGIMLPLSQKDEAERMSLQLYYRTATCLQTRTDLTGLTILEVSSGRGGGLDFLSREFPVKKAIGLDLSYNNIEWCRKTYTNNKKLEFVLGNAETFIEDGTLPPESIDIIINVDSAHLYPNFDQFMMQCSKALKKGGFVCISDFMDISKITIKEKIMETTPALKQVKIETTTQQILHAMDLDGTRRKKLVETHIHPLLKLYFKWQTGAKGSRIYKLLKSGQFIGRGWVYQKV